MAARTREGLLTKSPTSLKVTLRQLIVGRVATSKRRFASEYRLTQHFMQGTISTRRTCRADRQGPAPALAATTLAEVTDAVVDGYFAPLGDRPSCASIRARNRVLFTTETRRPRRRQFSLSP